MNNIMWLWLCFWTRFLHCNTVDTWDHLNWDKETASLGLQQSPLRLWLENMGAGKGNPLATNDCKIHYGICSFMHVRQYPWEIDSMWAERAGQVEASPKWWKEHGHVWIQLSQWSFLGISVDGPKKKIRSYHFVGPVQVHFFQLEQNGYG